MTGTILPMAIMLALAAFGCSGTRKAQPELDVASTYTPTSPDLERRDLPVTVQDLEILDRADAILSDEAKWNRQDDRICAHEDSTWSLFCALRRASVEVLGNYDHRRAALQEVRFAIEAAAPGQAFAHRLRDYNNLPATRFEDIKGVLHVARERVAARLAAVR